EQRTENPCVPGSIPGGTTQKDLRIIGGLFLCKKLALLFFLVFLFFKFALLNLKNLNNLKK
ncbi:MAG: hypothetical protein J6V62_01585, partial [Paludibacteraceae bacterium]|nr:hypothetical protein [Paludibacteraceae bacterium]